MSTSPLVSIITVNYNNARLTEELLESIARTNTYPAIEILVVDNASKVNPVPAWVVTYPQVKFLRSEQNLGFAGANNLAIRAAAGEIYFLVNNDTEFTAGLVDKLVRMLLDHPQIGMISPKINCFNPQHIIQFAGFNDLNFYLMRDSCIGEGEEDKGQYDHQAEAVGSLHGAAMMVTRAVTEKCGLMYENYFLFYEETDWCYRIKRSGYELWTNRDAMIYHKDSMSVGKQSAMKEYFMNRNRILFVRRNGSVWQKYTFYLFYTLLVLPKNVLGNILYGNFRWIPMSFRALWWNLTHAVDSQELGFKLP